VTDRRPQRGEIWNVFAPGQPTDPYQPRPALVISVDERNQVEDDVGVPIFSRAAPGPTHVPSSAGASGLHHDSVLFCEGITTLAVKFLDDGPIGEPVSELYASPSATCPSPAVDCCLPEVT